MITHFVRSVFARACAATCSKPTKGHADATFKPYLKHIYSRFFCVYAVQLSFMLGDRNIARTPVKVMFDRIMCVCVCARSRRNPPANVTKRVLAHR